MTKIVGIIMVIGLVGVLPIMLGYIIFGGGDTAQSAEGLVQEAENRVAENPRDLSLLVALSAQYQSVGRNREAEETLERAATLGAKTGDDLRILVAAFNAEPTRQAAIAAAFTKKYPRNVDGWLTSANIAAQTGDTLTARLAYQKVLDLAEPGSPEAQSAQAGLDALQTSVG